MFFIGMCTVFGVILGMLWHVIAFAHLKRPSLRLGGPSNLLCNYLMDFLQNVVPAKNIFHLTSKKDMHPFMFKKYYFIGIHKGPVVILFNVVLSRTNFLFFCIIYIYIY